MDHSLLLYTAIFVFTLMAVGLSLTVWEFSRGAPRDQAKTTQDRPYRVRVAHAAQRM
jgi:hypothetical protein